VNTAGIGEHELLVLCEDGKIYVWELRFSKRFKRFQENYSAVHNIRQIAVGRSMHIFIQGVLIPKLTEVLSCPESVPANAPFEVRLQLNDQFGPVVVQTPQISVYFTKEKVKASKSAIEFNLRVLQENGTSLEITPIGFGKYWLHILVNECEIEIQPVEIVPSPEELEAAKEFEELKAQEALKEKEQALKTSRAEIDKKKAQEQIEEANRKKKEETEKRAQDALKTHRQRQEKEKEDKEKERKQKLELKTGGGYDLSKKKK
jgi:hypothetical protein